MKFIQTIPHEKCHITLFWWNNKYIVKFEAGLYEQTYKISEMDISSESEVHSMLTDAFIASVMNRFEQMDKDWWAILE